MIFGISGTKRTVLNRERSPLGEVRLIMYNHGIFQRDCNLIFSQKECGVQNFDNIYVNNKVNFFVLFLFLT